MAIRFNRKTEETWKIMFPNQKNIDKNYRKRKGRVMFPTSHDITEESLDNCLIVLEKLLKSGNNVFIIDIGNESDFDDLDFEYSLDYLLRLVKIIEMEQSCYKTQKVNGRIRKVLYYYFIHHISFLESSNNG